MGLNNFATLKAAVCVEFRETTSNFSCVELFELFFFDIFIEEGWLILSAVV